MRHYVKPLILAAGLAAFAAAADANTLRFAEGQDINSMDPHAARDDFALSLLCNVYEGLVRWNADLEIEPALAESWEAISDTEWRFHLRKDVTFHNGNPFTADDVIFSYHRAGDAGSPFAGLLEPIAEVVKVDDYTVDFKLKRKYALVLNDFAGWYIMDKEFQEEIGSTTPLDLSSNAGGAMQTMANGTGPFKLVERQPDVKTVLAANPDWWDEKKHNLDEIVYTPISNNATRVAALLSGEVDFIRNAPPQDIDRIEATPGMKVMRGPHLRTIFFGMDQQSDTLPGSGVEGNPLKDVRVRKAIAMAMDVEGIKRSIMRGNSNPVATQLAPQMPFYDPALEEPIPFDPEGAKALLAEAGYGPDKPLKLTLQYNTDENHKKIAVAAQQFYKQIGVQIELNNVEWKVHTDRMQSQDFQMARYAWCADYNEASTFLDYFRTTGMNYGKYSNPEFDKLMDQSKTSADPNQQYTAAEKILAEDMPLVPIYQYAKVDMIRDDIKGLPTENVMNDWYAKDIYRIQK